ncbi:MAG: hypothetical protein LC650_04805 [Actinobacteria bacterium]|nr:hypothetical protein [Actinomycetota bacterium]
MQTQLDSAQCILNRLPYSPGRVTAKKVAQDLDMPRPEVNRILYRKLEGSDVRRTEDMPPGWYRVAPNANAPPVGREADVDAEQTFVIVDLGHVHRVLERAAELYLAILDSGVGSPPNFFVRGYADFGCNAYDVRWADFVCTAHEPGRNISNAMAICDIHERLVHKIVNKVVIVSKDKLFGDVVSVWRCRYPEVTFVICYDWDNLRLEIE